jgi:hypothetical protein
MVNKLTMPGAGLDATIQFAPVPSDGFTPTENKTFPELLDLSRQVGALLAESMEILGVMPPAVLPQPSYRGPIPVLEDAGQLPVQRPHARL